MDITTPDQTGGYTDPSFTDLDSYSTFDLDRSDIVPLELHTIQNTSTR